MFDGHEEWYGLACTGIVIGISIIRPLNFTTFRPFSLPPCEVLERSKMDLAVASSSGLSFAASGPPCVCSREASKQEMG